MATARHDPGTTRDAVPLHEFWRRIDPDGDQPARPQPEARGPATLILPGLYGSGADHWQSLWCVDRPDCRRVDLGDWDRPSRDLWVARLDRAIARERQPVVLAAHSLGCLAVAWWAAEASAARLRKVVSALLVAPPDVDRADAHRPIRGFAPAPRLALPFPALVVASRDDRYADFDRLAELAEAWEAGLVDAGPLGHVNADSDIADWPEGRALLDALGDPRFLDADALAAATGYAVRTHD